MEEESTTGQNTVYFLYRYQRFSDEFHSLQRMLSENLWWFGSRTGFDDKLFDCVLGGATLTLAGIERTVRESGGTELAIRNALNDSSLPVRIPRSVQKNSIDTIGILCLSELPDHPQLWREYADRGHGTCLCLATEKLLASLEYSYYKPHPVQYFDAPPHIWNPQAGDQLAEASEILLRKNQRWEYQREWRIMRSRVGSYRMPTDSLRAVILGSRLSEAKRRRIARWVHSGPWNPMPTIIPSRCP